MCTASIPHLIYRQSHPSPSADGHAPLLYSSTEEAKSACVARADCLAVVGLLNATSGNDNAAVGVTRVLIDMADYRALVLGRIRQEKEGGRESVQLLARSLCR